MISNDIRLCLLVYGHALTVLDYPLRCRPWSRCLQVHLRAYVPWFRQDAQSQSTLHRILGRHLHRRLDHFLGRG